MSDRTYGKKSAPSRNARSTTYWFYRWTEEGWEDIANWKAGKFTYSWKGSPSNKAIWVFDKESTYRPGTGIMKSRILIAFDFGADGYATILSDTKHIDFEDDSFKGEAKHPLNIIVKNNEPGSYGIGTKVREQLTLVQARLANKDEIAAALGVSEREGTKKQSW